MATSPLEVILSGPDGAPAAGGALAVRIQVRNVSDRAVWMVGVLGGSEAGYRFPRYTPTLTGPKPVVTPPESDGCGNVPPLRLQDFHRLAPGEGFDPCEASGAAAYLPLTTFTTFVPARAGRHELRLVLSTDSPTEEAWLGFLGYPGEEEVRARLKEVPRVRVASNVLVVDVTE